MTSPDRPKIGKEHREFGDQVAVIARDMSAFTLKTITDRFGQPPSEDARQSLRYHAETDIFFNGAGERTHSRWLQGNIAGSDIFALSLLQLPTEAGEDVQYPGRIIHMNLGYLMSDGQLEQSHLLYSGRDTPPIMAHESRVSAPGKNLPNPDMLSSLSKFVELLPESTFHFPEAKELTIIVGGLSALYDEINFGSVLERCVGQYEHEVSPDLTWFQQVAAQL